MEQNPIVSELEQRAKALNIPMYEVCRRAGVAASTPSRWKSGAGMTFSTVGKLKAVLDAAESAPAQAAA